MKITQLNEKPLASFRFQNAARRGGVPTVERIEVLHAECTGIPATLDGIIAAADLQGLEHWETARGKPPRLMGEVIPKLLVDQVLPGLNLRAEKTGIFLCGDLYTVPGATKRGGTGDVTEVWDAFGSAFRWVAGVAGNHDTFGADQNTDPRFPEECRFLDGNSTMLDGLKIAGIGGIIGSPQRVRRRTEDDYCEMLENLLRATPADVVLMHDGPDGPGSRQKGSPAIRAILNDLAPSLVIRGHSHWETPLVSLNQSTQVLNVDGRIVVLQHP